MRKKYTVTHYDWNVEVIWYDKEVTQEGIQAIRGLLTEEECPETKIDSICSLIESNNINSASIYSNTKRKKSIIIIGNTSSDSELVNSIAHEIIHLSRHINLCGNSENLATDMGDLAGKIYKDITAQYINK